MSNSDAQKSHYDNVWEVLKDATHILQGREIPLYEAPPAIADYLIMSVLAMGRANGVSEQAALAIIERQLNLLNDWRMGNPPFSNKDREVH